MTLPHPDNLALKLVGFIPGRVCVKSLNDSIKISEKKGIAIKSKITIKSIFKLLCRSIEFIS